MTQYGKFLVHILRGQSDTSIAFAELCGLLRHLGFNERIRGDHHIFTQTGVVEILNLQPRGGQAKPYQVRQVRDVIVKYRLGDKDDSI